MTDRNRNLNPKYNITDMKRELVVLKEGQPKILDIKNVIVKIKNELKS